MLKPRTLISSIHFKTRTLSSLSRQISNSQPQSLNEALLEMATIGLDVDFWRYDSLLNECINRRAYRDGQRVHSHMIKTRYDLPVYLGTRLVILYVKCAALEDARYVFEGMPDRSIVSWTALISGCSKRSYHSEALGLFVRMTATGLLPNEFTLASILPSCAGPCGLEHGRQVHSLAIKINFESHIFVGSSLLDMYAKASEIHEARRVFEDLSERDVVSCTAIISGYAQLGLDNEALEIFQKLYKEGMECNYVTFASLLTALSGLAAMDYGKQVHGITIRSRVPFYVVLQNSLIDMYSKCGNLIYSRRVFDNMSGRSVISWNTMLAGYAKHGLGEEVVELFKSMKKYLKPDGATYMALLSGCSHGGLVNEGLGFFDLMVKDGEVNPEIGHYGCVVDMLGRAGRIEEAFAFIRKMPFEPTKAIWGSLLGACRVHVNVSSGEFVAQKLLHLEPENAGNYVILSNIYAAAGKWEDVMRVRALMKEKTVVKEPARSCIKFGKTLHTFHTSDRSHPQKKEIEAKVRDVYAKLKEAGYVPDLSCVLHDVDDEQKERILLAHSEKLAIAFSLMQRSHSGTIQIIKNLRICVDCHNFAKFVSVVYGRELSLRDRSRFHLIVRGSCSCGDYW